MGINNDLISRSAAIEEFYKRIEGDLTFEEVEYIEKVIGEIPIAHNVDNVLGKLKEKIDYAAEKAAEYDEAGKLDLMEIYDTEATAYRNAERIVKAGGVDG